MALAYTSMALSVGTQNYERVEFGRYLSPLRYPGGKATLAPLLEEVILKNELTLCEYFEPFAGGAGAALRLLVDGTVSCIHLNDADVRVYTFWNVILNEPERFAETVLRVALNIQEWRKQNQICRNPKSNSKFDVAFAMFFLNRCNRSGVILGAGPIGGHAQSGKYHLGVRFDRERLAKRILAIATLHESSKLYNLDAIDFLRTRLPSGNIRGRVFVYLDPPYFKEGRRLYLSYYSSADHKRLADYMLRQKRLNWIASYDDEPEIRRLYKDTKTRRLPVNYSLNKCRECNELLIAPKRLKLPFRNPVKTTQAVSAPQ